MMKMKGPVLGARHLQTLLLFLAVMVNYSTRQNIAVSLVAMTDAKTTNPNFHEFDWTEQQKSYILSSFFWGYCLFQFPGGYAARKIGVKTTVLMGTFICSIAGLAVPFCVFWGGWKVFCVIRVIQGMCQGVLFPCVYQHIAKWSPVEERNFLGGFAHMGIEFGVIVAMYLTGMVAASDLGWPGIPYVFTGMGLTFSLLWLILAENAPAAAKFITTIERKYILSSQASVNDGQEKKNIAVPWKAMLTSGPLLSLIVVRLCETWGFTTMQGQLPSFMHGALKMDISQNAFFSALPYVTGLVFSYIFMIIADVLLKKKWTSLVMIRRSFSTIATWGPAALLISIGFLKENQRGLAITFITLIVGLNGGQIIGSCLNVIDLAPNHSGIMMASVYTLANMISIVCPLVVGIIVQDVTERSQWQMVFFITAGLFILGNLQFLFFVQTDAQPWNDEDYMTKSDTAKNEKVTQKSLNDISTKEC